MMSQPELDMSKLLWRCRRGMLELDILLSNFVKMEYAQLNQNDTMVFLILLDYPDQALFDLLLGKTESSDAMISRIVSKIRNACNDSSTQEVMA